MDLNADGHLDILSGSYSWHDRKKAMAGVFYVLWGEAGNKFGKPEMLNGSDDDVLRMMPATEKSPKTTLREWICTRPTAVDWNGDGHLDIVAGNFAGSFYWFKGEGKGKFSPKAERMMQHNAGKKDAKSVPLQLAGAGGRGSAYHSDPFPIDWDNDGDIDLLSGTSSGGVQWSENVAGAGKMPQLVPFQWLIQPAKVLATGELLPMKGDPTKSSRSSRIWVDDVNGDGKWDILLGDCIKISRPTKKGVTVAEMAKQLRKHSDDRRVINKKMSEIRKQMTALGKDEVANKKRMAFYKELAVLSKKTRTSPPAVNTQRTGIVWLYLQK